MREGTGRSPGPRSCMDAKPNDRARVLIHGDQDPVSPHRRRLAAEQIDTAGTVLHVTRENQPRRTAGIRLWSVLGGQDVSDKVLINGDGEGQGETCNARGENPEKAPTR